MQRVCLLASVVLALQGCGGSGGGGSTAKVATPAAVRQCVVAAQLRVRGGARPPGDTNAPNVELIASGPQAYAFLAFYDTAARAQKYAPMIRRNAKRFHGIVERHGKLTILWVRGGSTTDGSKIRNCATGS